PQLRKFRDHLVTHSLPPRLPTMPPMHRIARKFPAIRAPLADTPRTRENLLEPRVRRLASDFLPRDEVTPPPIERPVPPSPDSAPPCRQANVNLTCGRPHFAARSRRPHAPYEVHPEGGSIASRRSDRQRRAKLKSKPNQGVLMRNVLPSLLVSTVIALPLAGCARNEAAEAASAAAAAPPPQVSVAQVVQRPVNEFDEFTGRFEAIQHVDLRPRVSGYISSVNFVEGREVKKGDVLFIIDPRPYEAEFKRAKA